MIAAEQALSRLIDGNTRFADGNPRLARGATPLDPDRYSGPQKPFAVIVSCSDSRVPPEILFDQGIGDLFVVRSAGHVVDSIQLGSVEFGVDVLGTRLVVVLGHSECGAVLSTLESLRNGAAPASTHLGAIIDAVAPAVEPLLRRHGDDIAACTANAIHANVEATLDRLARDSDVIGERLADGRIALVGAEYQLNTGRVEFFSAASGRAGADD